MSGRFVSSGTIGPSGDAEKTSSDVPETSITEKASNPAWETVQKELDAERKRREEQRLKAATGEEKSLYDILQENKAAKQAAFEEHNKIRNQFRALDDDEIDFLDEVRAKERKEAEAVRRETEEGLKAFRERRKGGEVVAAEDGLGEKGEEQRQEEWSVGRKRKRVKDKEVKGVVRRRVSGGEQDRVIEKVGGSKALADEASEERVTDKPVEQKKHALGGLVSYGSDDSDDD